jgi:hypothetical protein
VRSPTKRKRKQLIRGRYDRKQAAPGRKHFPTRSNRAVEVLCNRTEISMEAVANRADWGQNTKMALRFRGRNRISKLLGGKPMRKYIIFRADWREEEGAENRLLAHTGAVTDILAEHFDSSEQPIPQPGYRLREYHRVEPFASKQFQNASTHSRVGDWEVVRVEEYSTNSANAEFGAIIVCYCRYSPVSTPLEPLPQIQSTQQLQETH